MLFILQLQKTNPSEENITRRTCKNVPGECKHESTMKHTISSPGASRCSGAAVVDVVPPKHTVVEYLTQDSDFDGYHHNSTGLTVGGLIASLYSMLSSDARVYRVVVAHKNQVGIHLVELILILM